MNFTSKYNIGDIVWCFYKDLNEEVRFIKAKILGIYQYDEQLGFSYDLLIFTDTDRIVANTIYCNCFECNIYSSREEVLNTILGEDLSDDVFNNPNVGYEPRM